MRLALFTFLVALCLHSQPTIAQEMVAVNEVYVNYLDKGTQTDFFVISNLNGGVDVNNAWLAVGLNGEKKMSGAVAVVCKNENGFGKVEHYYLNGYVPQLLDSMNPSVGLSKVSVSLNQGFLVCQFTRENTFNGFVSTITSGQAYLLTAFGAGTFGQHARANRGITAERVMITKPVTTNPPATAATSPVTNAPVTNAPVTNAPVTNVTNAPVTTTPMGTTTSGNTVYVQWLYENSMGFKLSWTNNADDTTDFTYETTISGNGNVWSAFALSDDMGMGMDSVAMCKVYCSSANSCMTSIEHYYNINRNSVPLAPNNRVIGFTNARVLRANGKLLCSFTRINSMPSQANYINSVEKPYYILNADGITDAAGTPLYHNTRRAVSPQTYSLVGSTLTTLQPIPTGFTTNAPVGTVQPIAVVLEQLAQTIAGFLSFLTRLVNQQPQ